MVLKEQLITREDTQNAFFSSFEGKYNIMDNLDEKGDPVIHARQEIYNTEYVFVTVVLRGTLNLTIGNTAIEMKANEYLAVMPCMSVEVKESRCIFFSFLTCSHLMADIYRRTDTDKKLHYHAFKFRHLRLSASQIEELLECYLRVKKEHLKKNYPMKEIVLRAYQSAYIAKFFSFSLENNIVNYVKNTRQYKLFNEFINLLNQYHKQERSVQYYAQKMQITPKYLSSIIQSYTRLTASQVIDQYVVYAIKQTLYTNERNIKTISAEYHFPSQSFFGRYFKRITGMSPNEYIKHHNIKSINFTKNTQVN